MIRDGLSSDEKRIKKNQKMIYKHEYKEDFLTSVVTAIENYLITGKTEFFKYLRDPYAILLVLSPMGLDIEVDDDAPDLGELTCKEYYEGVVNQNYDILKKMTLKEQLYCNLAGKEEIELPREEIIKEICKIRGIDTKKALETWELQPDGILMAFALGSERAILEGVTPCIGVPLKVLYPSIDLKEKIRFPLIVEKSLYDDYKLVHVHRDGDLFVVYDIEGEEVDFDDTPISNLQVIASSFVLEGFLGEFGEFFAVDLLCWNDIWLFNRPLSERIRMLWRFHEWNHERFVVRNYKQLNSLIKDKTLLRNTNSKYLPTNVDSHIIISGEVRNAFLQLGGRKGYPAPHLITLDKKAVMIIDAEIDKEDWGDIVEIKKDGTIVRNWGNKIKPDTWLEVADKWFMDEDYEKRIERKLPEARWVK